eukprot:3222758-Ditylum_brightwellii.AAC.1
MTDLCGTSCRSNETHCIKKKPIQEGYKFFALITAEEFLINFTPDGRSTTKSGRQEYEVDKTQVTRVGYLISEHGTWVAQWMDNGLVLLVSTIHQVGKHVLLNRRRPQITVKNKNHGMKVWGNNPMKDIYIP